MAKLTNRELDVVLSKLAKANSEAFKLQSLISEHSLEVYGVEPGEVDNDEYIDRVAGGNGVAGGMSAAEFDRSMRDCIERRQDC
ncbi:hypothetical protein [Aeromonas sp. S19(2024)]|uniref:hypothetical protein n=1 Tax=Aeromonas sp. S19(2024) TaxID=3242892 RepID=UPI003527C89F